MGSTYTSLTVHIVFSTKNREPFLEAGIASRVHEYLGGTVRQLGATPLGIGGVADHVHLIIGLKTTHSVSDVVREIKKGSTKWIREEFGMEKFGWQDGYAAISVSPERLPGVQKYVANQVEHHKKHSFREELLALLKMAGIEPDPRFLE